MKRRLAPSLLTHTPIHPYTQSLRNREGLPEGLPERRFLLKERPMQVIGRN